MSFVVEPCLRIWVHVTGHDFLMILALRSLMLALDSVRTICEYAGVNAIYVIISFFSVGNLPPHDHRMMLSYRIGPLDQLHAQHQVPTVLVG